jgi:hypothetical protein
MNKTITMAIFLTVFLFIASTAQAAYIGNSNLVADPTGTVNAVNPVPAPAAVWLLGSGLPGLVGIRNRHGYATDCATFHESTPAGRFVSGLPLPI